MKRLIQSSTLLALIFISTFKAHAQDRFKKAYYIDNASQKHECFILDLDWSNNPESFKYKDSENGEIKEITIKDVQSFEILERSKFVRADVKLDLSSEDINRLTDFKELETVDTTVFLRVLLEGEANLYLFEKGNLDRLFYSKKSAPSEYINLKYKA